MDSTVITRYPPSPTGHPHVGGVRTALFNYLFSKKNKGKIILRFEDTDKARSKKEFEESIFESMQWLDIHFDAIYKQSERTLVYKKYIEKMIENGTAYISNETAFVEEGGEGEGEESEGGGEKRSTVVRFKNPGKTVAFKDVVLGDISVDTTELKDFVIAKSPEEPLYHLAVVVDDFEMGITHVIRGVDGIYNTPRQILIQEAIGAPRPIYCHIPFVLGPDKAKLSKRNGSVPISEYKKQGFLPSAFINYLALLGWHPLSDKEIFTLDELVDAFELEKVQKAGAIFDINKLRWINREHMMKLSPDEFSKNVLAFMPESVRGMPMWSEERFGRFLPEIKNRISVWSDIETMSKDGEFDYIFDKPVFEIGEILPPQKDGSEADSKKIENNMVWLAQTMFDLPEESFTRDGVKSAIWEYATEKGRSDVLWPMRFALSGKKKSPDPFALAEILGKSETVERLKEAQTRLHKLNE